MASPISSTTSRHLVTLLIPLAFATLTRAQSDDITTSTDFGGTSTVGYENYYYVAIGILICVAGFCLFLYWKRKRSPARSGRLFAGGGGDALARDVGTFDPSRPRRRYWQGRWRGADEIGLEEGLNEHGEAPPPYLPKSLEESRNGSQVSSTSSTTMAPPPISATHLAAPAPTLAREDLGIKPPEYVLAETRSIDSASIPSTPADATSRHGTQLT